MLVTFRTNVHADITMFGDIAVALLKLMGHSGTVPSALPEEEVPTALNRLRAAIDGEVAIPAPDTDDEDNEPPVSLKKRALPLIELLEAAARANTYVMWK